MGSVFSSCSNVFDFFFSVLRALKSRFVRAGLSQELLNYSKIKPCLDNQQFEYIARLCNSALQVRMAIVNEI